MPKFLYTVIFANLALWFLWARHLLQTKPETPLNIITFLLLLFGAISLTLSILFYFYFHIRAKDFTNLRFLYRKGLKWGIYLSSCFVGFLAMRAFKIASLVNLGLFIVLYIVIYFQMKKRR